MEEKSFWKDWEDRMKNFFQSRIRGNEEICHIISLCQRIKFEFALSIVLNIQFQFKFKYVYLIVKFNTLKI